jgi:hypothetical protein
MQSSSKPSDEPPWPLGAVPSGKLPRKHSDVLEQLVAGNGRKVFFCLTSHDSPDRT